jgi:hypothetical protein
MSKPAPYRQKQPQDWLDALVADLGPEGLVQIHAVVDRALAADAAATGSASSDTSGLAPPAQ